MKRLLKWSLFLLALGGVAYFAAAPLQEWWKRRNQPQFHTAEVVRGDIVAVVNATGTINPVRSIRVGSFVSGPVDKLYVDFNTPVKKADGNRKTGAPPKSAPEEGLLAKIDPKIYEAVRSREEANLDTAKQEVERVRAQLEQAKADERRGQRLRDKNKNYLSEAEMDKLRCSRAALEAQLGLAQAQVKQAQAGLRNAEINLQYTEITSPVDGVIIDRKIDEKQTLVAQFQVPDLFVVAENLLEEVHVHASVDEADVGLIREAQRRGNDVHFSVDAYPDDLFVGRVFQVRMNHASKENVVTYDVVVKAPNAKLDPLPGTRDPLPKLMPGMTAKVSFEIDRRSGALKCPNAALRFYPKPEMVRDEDKAILEGTGGAAAAPAETAENADKSVDSRSALQRILDHRSSNRRHVWVVQGDKLRAIEVTTGLNDYRHTEIVSGELTEGLEVVTAVKK